MSEALDNRVLSLLSEMISGGSSRSDVDLVRRLWKERSLAVNALVNIRDWDMMHDRARDLDLVDDLCWDVLEQIDDL